ncbi:fimbrial biogenesis outer membrane usher protein [Serratia fonticola]|uniref:fimbria/pilus outer membrane usher protein n=1 Tax=Serratia fonticola TaxID=47917 RepID=UPI0015C647DC|nr:fimbria/pilus outer membrane usher protein [Serratia fonticola]MBC3378342.1 fimbrial biogenesis outer membrane usher protein [Serratia fonticola]NYA37542.1 fimbrial biogenesis outer membrane usher protein [Serratia fonticola]
MLGTLSLGAQARDYFNPALLEMDNPHQGSTDLSVFEEGDLQAPGTYRVDIYINNEVKGTSDVEFRLLKDAQGKEHLHPCLSVAQLNEMGVKTHLFPGMGDATAKCADLSVIPQASAEFHFSSQQLQLSIPQAAMQQDARGYMPESQWESGISALLLNYGLNGATAQARDGSSARSNSTFVNLRPGLNIGPWRLRNYTTWNRDNSGQGQWNTIYTYIQRDIVALKSQLTLGDGSSPSDVFDSVPFRGAQLTSDEDMIPDSLKGYAPVVRGIARTNAQVTIRQNGYVIYQNYVTPGAFEINDMFPTGGSGDLQVTIKETDGSEQRLVVPFASLPVLQREGRLKYAVSGGQYRSYDSSVEKNTFAQGTAIYGLPLGFTGYGGGQLAEHYQALVLGMGKNLGNFGALSADITHAESALQNAPKTQGQSWRLRYSKNIVQTGTNFAIAGYRYSTDGFYGMQEVMDTYRDQNSAPGIERRRNRTEVTLNQNLWQGAGALSLGVVNEDYWNSERNLRSIGMGYSNSWQGISYSLNYSYNINASAGGNSSNEIYDKNHLFAFNISVPLSNWLSNSYANYSMNTSQKGGTTHSAGLNGSALAERNLSWGVRQGYSSQDSGVSGNLNADYRGTYGQISAGYGYDPQSWRLNYGLQGGIIAHENGVTFGQPLGETVALVRAPGAAGVSVSNQVGVKTDWRGYAIVPYGTPYRKNQVRLNTETLPDDVELAQTSQNLVPTRGAVVRASFDTQIGERVMMTLLKMDGAPVPFGATVSDPAKKTAQGFIVGDSGQVYLTGLAERGTLIVKWGNEANQTCKVAYSLSAHKKEKTSIKQIDARCQ